MSLKCSNCGVEIDEDAKECPACGAQFAEHQSAFGSVPASLLGISTGILAAAVLFIIGLGITLTLGVGATVALVVWIAAELLL
jgi:hypothetical protein